MASLGHNELTKLCSGFIAVREMSVRNKNFQGQGIVMEFYKVSGKFWHLAKLMKSVIEFHIMSGKMTILDNMTLQSPRISTNFAKLRLKIFSISTFSGSLIMDLRLFCWHHHLWKRSLILRYAPYNLPSTLLLLRFVREIWILSGRCQGNVREFWRSLMLWTLLLLLRHGWVIISHCFTWMQLLIHVIILMLLWLISVS